jgi:hypothetical protein
METPLKQSAPLSLFLVFWLGLPLFLLAAGEPARPSTVLPPATLQLLADEVNGFAAFNTVAMISTYHRTLGSDETAEVLRRLQDKCRDFGIRAEILAVPVRTGREFFGLQDFDGQVPTRARRAELRLVKPRAKLIATTESSPSSLIQGSRSVDLIAPLVFVGEGDKPENYEGKDIKGKIVLAGNAMPEDVKETAIHRYGAAGVLFYFDLPHNSGENDDAVLDIHWSPWGQDGRPSTFGISLATTQYRFLKGLLDRKEEVVVRVKVDAEIKAGEEAVFETLDAVIPGTEFPEEEFWVWAHIDHPLPGAVDNASGCGVALEIARTLQGLIENGLLPPPKRTIRFLWLPHVTGLYMYLSRHPEKIGKVRGGLSIDSVGIHQSVFSNSFAPGRPSHSLPSYWNAVLENLADHLASRTNRDLLDFRNRDNLFSPEGSRDQFNMRVIPYNGFGDEMQSNNNTVAIPTISFGCLPVPPRHSQVNFLSYVDPTGLHRVAYLGAALAAVFGWTDGSNVGRIIDEVYGRGRERLTGECGLAFSSLVQAGPADLAEARKRGRSLLSQGLKREAAMLESIKPLVPNDRAPLLLVDQRIGLQRSFASALQADLDRECSRRAQELGLKIQELPQTRQEKELDGLVPVPVPGIIGTSAYFGNYYEKMLGKEKLRSFGLKPGFSYGHIGYTEAHNFINGRRSILGIYEAVAAELWSEGYPSGHSISMIEVAAYMRMLEAAGTITLERRAGKSPGPER